MYTHLGKPYLLTLLKTYTKEKFHALLILKEIFDTTVITILGKLSIFSKYRSIYIEVTTVGDMAIIYTHALYVYSYYISNKPLLTC